MKEKIEYIVFSFSGDEIQATVFVVSENKNSITIALTKSYGEFIDVQILQKNDLISRSDFNQF